MTGFVAAAEPLRRRTRLTPVGAAVLFVGVLAVFMPGARLFGSAVIAMMMVAPLLSSRGLRGLRVGSPSVACCMAGEEIDLELPVCNDAALFAVRDVTFHRASGPTGGLRPAAFLPALGPGGDSIVRAAFRSTRRGRTKAYAIVALTSFPFGLAFSLAEYEVPADLLVLPRPGSVTNLAPLAGLVGGRATRRLPPVGHQGEFRSLREWREGESHRLVHWKISARRGRTIVRELTDEDRRPIHIVLATGVSHLTGRGRSARAFERSVAVTTTLVAHLLRTGHRVRLTLTGADPLSSPPKHGRAGLYPLLAMLAEVQPFDGPPTGIGAGQRRGERTLIVVSGRSEDAQQAGLPGGALVFCADDPGVREGFSRVPAAGARTRLGAVA